jgi:hypothetical protein
LYDHLRRCEFHHGAYDVHSFDAQYLRWVHYCREEGRALFHQPRLPVLELSGAVRIASKAK